MSKHKNLTSLIVSKKRISKPKSHRLAKHASLLQRLNQSYSSLTGSLIILVTALLAIATIRYYSHYDWYGLVGMTPDEVAQTLLDIRESRVRDSRLDMGEYDGKANIRKNYPQYDQLLSDSATKHDLDCTLLKAVMLAESHANPKATSKSGAIGLMQVLPGTARAMGVYGNLYNPANSIEAGARYLKHLQKTGCNEQPANTVCNMNQDYKYLIAAYNGGSGANDHGLGNCSNLPAWECAAYQAYRQTRFYVGRVKANYDLLKDKAWGCN